MTGSNLHRADLDGVELEYEVSGGGEAVVLLHAGLSADWFTPLMGEAELADRYRLVRYHRAGYAGSTHPDGPVSIADHATHCRLLLDHLGIERAHLVGHSSSGMMALQLALDAPERVGTLTLLESARPAPSTPVQAAFVADVVGPAMGRYRAGDRAGAVDTWMRGTCGPDWRGPYERVLPGAVERAVADADTFFGQELPAVQAWSFEAEDAARITQPVLAVLGTHSVATFGERRELLASWLADVELFDLPDATHLLHVEQPARMAAGLADFLGRHPLSRRN